MKKEIHIDELKGLQLEILDYVDHFCRTHNIKYSLCGGTMLGAIRHGGYIPWDDDIDIQLMRAEYDKLIEVWNRYEHPYVFHTLKYGNSCGFAFGKISNPKTVMVDVGQSYMGVNIDVFPIDDVIDESDFQTRRHKVMRLYDMEERKRRYYKNISFIKLAKKYFWKFVLCYRSRLSIAEEISNIAQMNNGKNAKYIFEIIDGRGYKSYYPKSVSDTYTDVTFENKKYMAFRDYDKYLTSIFGDYMELPPVEKRVSHHEFEAYWK